MRNPSTRLPINRQSGSETIGGASVPNLTGVWTHPAFPWFEPPASGPSPLVNLSRKNGVSNYDQMVGDYKNPILQPWAADVVKRHGVPPV